MHSWHHVWKRLYTLWSPRYEVLSQRANLSPSCKPYWNYTITPQQTKILKSTSDWYPFDVYAVIYISVRRRPKYFCFLGQSIAHYKVHARRSSLKEPASIYSKHTLYEVLVMRYSLCILAYSVIHVLRPTLWGTRSQVLSHESHARLSWAVWSAQQLVRIRPPISPVYLCHTRKTHPTGSSGAADAFW